MLEGDFTIRLISERLNENWKEGLQCSVHPWRHYTSLMLKLSWATLQGTTSPKQAVDSSWTPSIIVLNTTIDWSKQVAIITVGLITVTAMPIFLFQLMLFYDRKDAFFTYYNVSFEGCPGSPNTCALNSVIFRPEATS